MSCSIWQSKDQEAGREWPLLVLLGHLWAGSARQLASRLRRVDPCVSVSRGILAVLHSTLAEHKPEFFLQLRIVSVQLTTSWRTEKCLPNGACNKIFPFVEPNELIIATWTGVGALIFLDCRRASSSVACSGSLFQSSSLANVSLLTSDTTDEDSVFVVGSRLSNASTSCWHALILLAKIFIDLLRHRSLTCNRIFCHQFLQIVVRHKQILQDQSCSCRFQKSLSNWFISLYSYIRTLFHLPVFSDSDMFDGFGIENSIFLSI